MTHRDDPGIENDACSRAELISLCAHRRRRHHSAAVDGLVDALDDLHRRAIAAHNRAIKQADLSVFAELCKTLGLHCQSMPSPYRAALAIPAALYGRSEDAIFGQRPFQHQLRQTLDDPALFDALCNTRLAVYRYQPTDAPPTTGTLTPHLAPAGADALEGVTLLCQAGRCADEDGVYSGWLIDHDDQPFLVFAHRLDDAQRSAIAPLLDDRPASPSSFHLCLLRALLAPDAPRIETAGGARPATRPPASRAALHLAIQRALWRQFAEPQDGLTIHAHIALLIDDPPAFQSFLDEIDEIRRTTTLRYGGAPPKSSPLTLDEILAPYHVDTRGRLQHRQPLWSRPTAFLLLDDDLLHHLPFSSDAPLGETLQWARSHPDDPRAHHVDIAFSHCRMEANLLATYGLQFTADPSPNPPAPAVIGHLSPILPNLRVLFHPDFLHHRLRDLPLPDDLRRGLQGLPEDTGPAPLDLRLCDLRGDERDLIRHHGLAPSLFPTLRQSLLAFAASWRHHRLGGRPD